MKFRVIFLVISISLVCSPIYTYASELKIGIINCSSAKILFSHKTVKNSGIKLIGFPQTVRGLSHGVGVYAKIFASSDKEAKVSVDYRGIRGSCQWMFFFKENSQYTIQAIGDDANCTVRKTDIDTYLLSYDC